MPCELVKTVTSDGLRLDGSLTRGVADAGQAVVDAVICLPGVASTFYGSSLLQSQIEPFAKCGVAVLCANTRGHDNVFTAQTSAGATRFGAAYETVDECRFDIAAWVQCLQQRGFARIALLGHSLGAIKALYYQAHEDCEAVRAVIAMSPPRLSYRIFEHSHTGPSFIATMLDAKQRIQQQRGDELMEIQFPYPLLITAAAYVDKYGPSERYDIAKFAGRMRCPVLFTYGQRELVSGNPAFTGLPELLASVCGDNVDFTTIADADHLYTGVQNVLAESVMEWLGKLRQ